MTGSQPTDFYRPTTIILQELCKGLNVTNSKNTKCLNCYPPLKTNGPLELQWQHSRSVSRISPAIQNKNFEHMDRYELLNQIEDTGKENVAVIKAPSKYKLSVNQSQMIAIL